MGIRTKTTETTPAAEPADNMPVTTDPSFVDERRIEPAEPEASEPEREPTDYFATWRSIRAGEKLQLLQRLNVTEAALAQLGTAQMLAVAWKHRKTTTGNVKINDLLDMTEDELFEVAGLTADEFVAQVEALEDDDSKSV